MKTAVEQLIDEMQSYSYKVSKEGNLDMVAAFDYAIGIAKKYKEKEKEQIIEAGNACGLKAIVYHQKLSEMSKDELIGEMVEDGMSHGEEYYNQTYKPETI